MFKYRVANIKSVFQIGVANNQFELMRSLEKF